MSISIKCGEESYDIDKFVWKDIDRDGQPEKGEISYSDTIADDNLASCYASLRSLVKGTKKDPGPQDKIIWEIDPETTLDPEAREKLLDNSTSRGVKSVHVISRYFDQHNGYTLLTVEVTHDQKVSAGNWYLRGKVVRLEDVEAALHRVENAKLLKKAKMVELFGGATTVGFSSKEALDGIERTAFDLLHRNPIVQQADEIKVSFYFKSNLVMMYGSTPFNDAPLLSVVVRRGTRVWRGEAQLDNNIGVLEEMHLALNRLEPLR